LYFFPLFYVRWQNPSFNPYPANVEKRMSL
jgi:hypothetical protein